MGSRTGISWTEKTWNPWVGCDKVSPGCDNCYMFREQIRYGNNPEVVRRTKTWGDPKKWNREAERLGKQFLVFTCSWSDFFHADADEWRPEAWEIIKATPHMTYQILTKRVALIERRLPPDWGAGYPNVWLGCSAENQEQANLRIPRLRRIPAALRWVSAEPLLGPIDFLEALSPEGCQHEEGFTEPDTGALVCRKCDEATIEALDWIVVGGESGPGPDARPFDLRWARDILDQCKYSGTACFVKQLGARPVEATGRSFECFQTWVNKASSWMEKGDACIDQRGRVCAIGADMQRARDEGAFPVEIYRRLHLNDRAGADPSEWKEYLRVQEFPR